MKVLEWNEEYAISFIIGGNKFFTPLGKGFNFIFDAKDEVKRLKSKGATDIKIYTRKWN